MSRPVQTSFLRGEPISIFSTRRKTPQGRLPPVLLWRGDVEAFLNTIPNEPAFDLIITSPPYNLGKAYEQPSQLSEYLAWQQRVISRLTLLLKPTGSICWQVGNYVEKRRGGKSTTILPLDMLFHGLFQAQGLKLRNRIVWHFGHGLHCRHRFSGRYEVVLWYTKSDDYVFNLDPVRVDAKYPGKKAYKGPRAGQYSSNPLGKNPEDVWLDIPNVKSNHIEKTIHPCQFPVALVERLVLALTNPHDLVFDPFAGVASAGVAAVLHDRRFWGAELDPRYVAIGAKRLEDTLMGHATYRPLGTPIYDHKKSPLSRKPYR